jgi:hypothetical protein
MSLIRFNHRARRIAVALSLASTAFLAAAGEAELPKLVVGDRYVYHQTRSDLPPPRSESRAEFKVGWVSSTPTSAKSSSSSLRGSSRR